MNMQSQEITPRKIHFGITNLCKRINPDSIPIYVPVHPEVDAHINDCFVNVQKKITKDGGTILHGWAIWEIPGLFAEAEFHGIWLSPTGQHIDVSPRPADQTQTLFLPDPDKIFDEQTFNRCDNIRIPLADHPSVHAFIKHCEAIFCYEESHTDPLHTNLFSVKEDEYAWYLQRKAELQIAMGNIIPGRNDPCRCGSGLKFKKCCLQKTNSRL